jgi:Tfp pilus assembly protein FimT
LARAARSSDQARRGFTIVKLLIVVAIAILAAIAIAPFNRIYSRAKCSLTLPSAEQAGKKLRPTRLPTATRLRPHALVDT